MGRPNPDPGEEYPHVNTQLFGSGRSAVERDERGRRDGGAVQRAARGHRADDRRVRPRLLEQRHAAAQRRGADPRGGVAHHGRLLARAAARALHARREFAVFDAWFAAVPSQTYCNRSFFHASTSHGFVTNQARRRLRQVAGCRSPRRRSSTVSKRPASRGRSTSTSSSSSRSRASCTRPRSRSSGAPSTSATCRSSTRTRRPARCPPTRSSSRAWSTTTTTSIRPSASTGRATSRARWSSIPPCRMCAPARSSSPTSTTRSGRARRPTARTR